MAALPWSYPRYSLLVDLPRASEFHSADGNVSPLDLLMSYLRRQVGDPRLVPGDVVLPAEFSIRIGAKVRGWLRKTVGISDSAELDVLVGQMLRDARPLAVPRRDTWSPPDKARVLPRAERAAAKTGGAR